MKRREFFKGLGLVAGGAVLMKADFLRANETKISNEPEYDIKVITNIKDSKDAWCTVTDISLGSRLLGADFIRIPINKDGIAYIVLPDNMKFKFVDISLWDISYTHTRVSDVYITDKPQEIFIMSREDENYYANV